MHSTRSDGHFTWTFNKLYRDRKIYSATISNIANTFNNNKVSNTANKFNKYNVSNLGSQTYFTRKGWNYWNFFYE